MKKKISLMFIGLLLLILVPAMSFATSERLVEEDDYMIKVKVVEEGKKDIPTIMGGQKATIRVTIQGTKDALTIGRPYYFTIDNATVIRSVPVDKTGIGKFSFDSTENWVSEFVIEPSSDTKMEFVTDIYVAPNADNGVITMNVESSDIGESASFEIGYTEKALLVESSMNNVKKGELMGTSDIVITEGKAGQLKKGEYLYVIFDNMLKLGDKPVISSDNGLRLGTISWVKNVDGNTIGVATQVVSNSTKEPAVITFTDMNAELSAKSISDRAYKANIMVGSSYIREYNPSTSPLRNYASLDYVKSVGDSNTIVFTVGSSSYTVGGKVMALDAPVFTTNGRTMLPVGPLGLALNLEVDYDVNTKTASFRDPVNGKVVRVTEGSDIVNIDDSVMKMDAPAISKNGRIFVPVASVAKAFGANVEWMPINKQVVIN